MKSNDVKMQFVEFRARGLSYDNIAKELGVAKGTLIEWSKQYENDIANLKAIEMEMLQEQYFIAKRARIEIMGELAIRVKGELAERELTDVSTEKLIDLFLKTIGQLKQEEIEIEFRVEKQVSLDDMLDGLDKTLIKWKAV